MSGSAQWCPARTQIHWSAKASAISEICILSVAKLNTPTLPSSFSDPISRTSGNRCLNSCHRASVCCTSSFSIRSISRYPPTDSMNSIARRRLPAQMICGVPGSNRDGRPAGAKLSSETQFIAPPPPIDGTSAFRSDFFPYIIPSPVSDMSLCPVNTI